MKDESLLPGLASNEDISFIWYIFESCLGKVFYHCFLRRLMRPGPYWIFVHRNVIAHHAVFVHDKVIVHDAFFVFVRLADLN